MAAEHKTNTRKTISVYETAFERCDGLKEQGESWSEFLERAADALESSDGSGEHGVNTLTPDHIDDIANTTAQRTAEELEARLR